MQSKTKLTDAVVARAVLPDGKSEAVIWDSEVTGFGLRLRGVARTYIVSYRPAGQGRAANTKRVRLGTPSTIRSVADARKLAFAMLGKVAAGGDPAKDRKEEKRRKNARVYDLLNRYEKDLTRRGYVAVKMVMSLLRRRLKKHAGKDIADLKGADYAAIIEALERTGQAGAAEEFRTRCRAFLAFCQVKAKVIENNPLFGFRRQRATRADRLTKQEHGRALSDDELRTVWLAAKPTTAFGRFVRFLILSGCRRGEGAGFEWPMIAGSKDNATKIVLPAVFVKQGRDHTVNITPALDELLALCVKDTRSDLVFPSLRTGGPMSGWNKMKAALVKESGVTFTFHDLRRTFRTGLTKLGIDSETAELALGHARENLIEIYERGGGAENVRKAFLAWSLHVTGLVAIGAGEGGVFG